MKIILEMTREQAQAVMNATELLARHDNPKGNTWSVAFDEPMGYGETMPKVEVRDEPAGDMQVLRGEGDRRRGGRMMAEFQEVIKQWGRMCDGHVCAIEDVEKCPEKLCPIAGLHDGFPCEEDPKCWTDECAKQFEDIVMAWAAENPEPVYPTWREYIYDYCVKQNPDLRGCNDYQFVAVFMGQPIPADIAQKLEIEPIRR